MKSRIVVALGGNALGNTPAEQLALVKRTAKPIVDLIGEGHAVILTHGNGPQVGMINLAMERSAATEQGTPEMPLPECGAMSQGYIGFHLQNAIREELQIRGYQRPVASVVTQVVVADEDPAFGSPTKPIGKFYTEKESAALVQEKGWQMIEDSGRGFRRVVPSPKPIDVVEKETVSHLVENGHVVIAGGGGGIPVIRRGHRLVGVPAVIDKDLTSAKLAEVLDAEVLIILTAVEKVALNFGKMNEVWLTEVTSEEAKQYVSQDHFAKGSMLEKVEAAIAFVESHPGRKALITSLEKAVEGIKGRTGTWIVH